jgi:cytochrome c-type biogenesis protein CcmF
MVVIIELGHLATILALVLSVVAVIASIVGAKWDASFLRVGRASLHAVTLLIIFGCLTIVYAFLKSDFSVLYVAMNSNTRLPIFYKIAALWGGHEGSLLMWAGILSFFGSLVLIRHWKSDPDFMPAVTGVFATLTFGFLSLILFLSSPFERLFPAAPEGRDLNPLLQDFQMVIHPPTLFAGYTGYAVPFAFAIAVLLTGRGIDRWVFVVRRWSLVAWMLLTAGIALGGHWAYRELGWGGYWAWDPVENASFMPWLIGTALLHSVMVQEQRKSFRIWNISLAITAFSLSILGTFLVRSGVISSVHAFASDPSRGIFLLGFFFVILIASFGLLVYKADRIQSEDDGTSRVLSRETFFLFNNWVFLVATFTVMLGTLFPSALELLGNTKVTVAAPFFNKTFVPIILVNILLMTVAPMLPWRKFTGEQLRRVTLMPAIVAIIAMIGLVIVGIRIPLAVISLGMVVFGMIILAREWYRSASARARSRGTGFAQGFARMVSTNRRRFGGLVAHFGMLILVIGFVGSYAYQSESSVGLAEGEKTAIGNYEILYTGTRPIYGPNWSGFAGVLDIYRGGNLVGHLEPEKRFYARSDMPMTEPARMATLTHELYVAIGDMDPKSGAVSMHIYLNPFVHFVWAGIVILILGGMVSYTHRIRSRGKT